MNKRIQFISVPTYAGTNREGTNEAPRVLCQCLGVEPVREIKFPSIVELCKALRDTIYQTCAKGIPMIIGGDHSIALGSVAGSLMHDANLGVVWFDAHGDINTERTSPTSNAHGMPVAALMGLCESELNEVATVRLKPQNMFWIGARDLDPGEKETIERLGIEDHVYSTDYIHQVGMEAVMQEVADKMQARDIRHWHLSFDIDGMDPMLIPATGVPVPKGMNEKDLEEFIEGMQMMPELNAMDFVEYNPLLDDAEMHTGMWCVETIKSIKNETLLQIFGKNSH